MGLSPPGVGLEDDRKVVITSYISLIPVADDRTIPTQQDTAPLSNHTASYCMNRHRYAFTICYYFAVDIRLLIRYCDQGSSLYCW